MIKILLAMLAVTGVAIPGFLGKLYGKASPKLSQMPKIDTVYADRPLAGASLLANAHVQYSMLIYNGHTYTGVKLLDEQITVNGSRVNIVQKLYDGSTCSTDSVFVDRRTLAPFESYSATPSSRDSFSYKGDAVLGTLTAIETNKRDTVKNVSVSLLKPMFNGLTYAITYQSLSYKMGVPFYLAQYVPGHNVNFERVEYVGNEEITQNGVHVRAMVLEIKKTNTITIRCWLHSKTQELLKIEGRFPAFTYSLVRL